MPKSKRWIIRSIFVSLVALTSWSTDFTVLAIAQPMPLPNLQRWLDESNLIVKGRVLAVHETETTGEGSSRSHKTAASVQIDRIFKGSVNGKVLVIEYQWYPQSEKAQTVSPNTYNLVPNQYGLFFLTSGKAGVYDFADPYEGMMPITSRSVSLVEGAHTTKEKLEAELFASLSDTDPNVAKTALAQVRRLGVEQFIKPLHEIAFSTDPASQGLAFAALIRLGDYSLFRPAIQFVEKPTKDPNMQYWNARVADAIGDIGNFQIRRALEAGGDQRSAYCPSRTKIPFDRSVPPLLDSLLSSPNVELRRVAAHALRGICDPSSARFLVGALNDSDRAVQYDAMMGLAALEDFPTDRPAPAASIFNANPAKYLDNWKNWWKTSGEQKYSLNR